jgi:multiple sugar transport system permease protein
MYSKQPQLMARMVGESVLHYSSLLKSTILAVLMLGFIIHYVFDIVWIMTKGGPGSATEVLPTLAYRLSFINFNFGQSAVVSVIILAILLIAAVLYLKSTYSEEKLWAENE